MGIESEDQSGNFTSRINLISMGKGILAGYILIIPVFIFFAYAVSLMKYPEKYITGTVIIANVISVIVAGSISASKASEKGWLNGAIAGFIYYAILFLISGMISGNFHIGLSALSTLITSILAGSFGGMLGINIKRPSRHKFKRA